MRRLLWLAAASFAAFALSYAYLGYYLRGGPRVIDATSYWLEARSLAAGSFTFAVPEPTGSFRGRFLLGSPDGQRLGVIFPAGYPLVLALGMRLGAPLLVGPSLGAMLVAATYALARSLAQPRAVAATAALLSVVCAALRYHTADTMSHGLAALLACTALLLTLRAAKPSYWLGAGLCLGLLAATRPVSGGVALLLTLAALHKTPRALGILALGMAPGVALLLAQQHALTGSYLGSTQLAYYAAADAPAGCFRYGFGAGIGCRFEHGDYVTRYLPDGYGLTAALRNLLVRLGLFATDATNAAPLTLVGLYALARHRKTGLALLGVGIALQALAYVPFYFDGNYPGGGARFLCEVIPFCQILVARALFDLRLIWLGPVAALAGFAIYSRHGHEELRAREGGRPMYEPAVVARAGVTSGLVFVDTDHGFNLGHDPRASDVRRDVWVARARGDAHDSELFERLGRPPTYTYSFDLTGQEPPRLLRISPSVSPRVEAEAEWPAPGARGNSYPIHFPCASRGRALRLWPGAPLRLPIGWAAATGSGETRLGWLGTTPDGSTARARWTGGTWAKARLAGSGCSVWVLPAPSSSKESELEIELLEGEGALDFVEARPG
jgi:hypothetical protein